MVRKTREGTSHPDRNAQFEHINATAVKRFLQRRQPVISVDTKKKEFVGPYKNKGQSGSAREPNEWTSMISVTASGKVIPYGVFDMGRNEAWVSVGSTTTPCSSPCRPSGGGGRRWAAYVSPR